MWSTLAQVSCLNTMLPLCLFSSHSFACPLILSWDVPGSLLQHILPPLTTVLTNPISLTLFVCVCGGGEGDRERERECVCVCSVNSVQAVICYHQSKCWITASFICKLVFWKHCLTASSNCVHESSEWNLKMNLYCIEWFIKSVCTRRVQFINSVCTRRVQ